MYLRGPFHLCASFFSFHVNNSTVLSNAGGLRAKTPIKLEFCGGSNIRVPDQAKIWGISENWGAEVHKAENFEAMIKVFVKGRDVLSLKKA